MNNPAGLSPAISPRERVMAWINQIQVHSDSSSAVYTVSQQDADGLWACSCRKCKHLTRLGLDQSPGQVVKAAAIGRDTMRQRWCDTCARWVRQRPSGGCGICHGGVTWAGPIGSKARRDEITARAQAAAEQRRAETQRCSRCTSPLAPYELLTGLCLPCELVRVREIDMRKRWLVKDRPQQRAECECEPAERKGRLIDLDD